MTEQLRQLWEDVDASIRANDGELAAELLRRERGLTDRLLAPNTEPYSDAEIDAAGEAMYGDNWEQVKRFGWHIEQLQRALVAVDQVRRKG
jgi:hypothetical protein